MKDVQCYELFGGIALENHAFSCFHFICLCLKCKVVFIVFLFVLLCRCLYLLFLAIIHGISSNVFVYKHVKFMSCFRSGF